MRQRLQPFQAAVAECFVALSDLSAVYRLSVRLSFSWAGRDEIKMWTNFFLFPQKAHLFHSFSSYSAIRVLFWICIILSCYVMLCVRDLTKELCTWIVQKIDFPNLLGALGDVNRKCQCTLLFSCGLQLEPCCFSSYLFTFWEIGTIKHMPI